MLIPKLIYSIENKGTILKLKKAKGEILTYGIEAPVYSI